MGVAKMLYELIGIVRPGKVAEVKEIATSVGSLILRNGGVVRGISNWGVFSLPRPISVHQMKHTRPLLCHALRLEYQSPRGHSKQHETGASHDPRDTRQVGRRAVGEHGQVRQA